MSLEQNDRMLQSGFSGSAPRPAQVDVGGSVLDGIFASKMSVGADFQCLFFVFFQIFPSILSILFLGRSFFLEINSWKRENAKHGILERLLAGADSLSLRIWFKSLRRHEMNLLFVPQILSWAAILALQSANASTCNKKFSVEQLRCFLGEDASFWQDQSHRILSLLTLTKDFLLKICEMLWEQLQDNLICIAGVLLTMFLLGHLLHRCCSHADGYRTLMNVQDDLGIDELFEVRLGILQGAIFMAIDVTLDNVNGIMYCWRGLKVFGPLTLAIPVVSGFCCFLYKRNSWALAPIDHTDATGKKTDFFYQKRDRNGPGLKSAILQMLQVEAFLTAHAAYKDPQKYEREWKVETAFNDVVEGFPSALLQTYTLFCMEHSNSLPGPFSTYINIVSILFSAYSIGKALNVISLELLPQTKVEPPPGGLTTTQLKMLQSLDVFARISVLAAIGISLRPAADMTVNCQFYLPTLMLLELLVIWTMSKWYFGWRSFFAADSILFTVLEYFSVPMLVGTGVSLQKQLRMQLCTMTWRAMELAGGSILVWYNIHTNPQKPHLYVVSFTTAGACAFSVAVTIIILDRRLRYLGEPLLPAANSKGYGKLHWASALNNQALLRKIPYNELRHSDSEQSFAHVAAEHGHEEVLEFLHEVVPGTLMAADDNGRFPAHVAAMNSHEEVLEFLQELVPETLKAADRDGDLPAHLAAQNGHEGVVQFLYQVCPETLKTANRDGVLPAHVAAQNGHEGVLQFLHQVCPETLKTAAGNGALPAHWAALNGHEGVVRFLHQVVPETLETADADKAMPAHWAAGYGHEGVVQFLHQVVPETLKTASRHGALPAHFAATNGHEGVVQFLHQVVPETLKTAAGDGKLPAHWAAENGHEGVLQFLHQVVPETLKTANGDGQLPVDVAVLQDESAESDSFRCDSGESAESGESDLEGWRWRWIVASTYGRWKWPRRSDPISPRSGFWRSCSFTLTKCCLSNENDFCKSCKMWWKTAEISKSCESKNWAAWQDFYIFTCSFKTHFEGQRCKDQTWSWSKGITRLQARFLQDSHPTQDGWIPNDPGWYLWCVRSKA